MEPHLDDTMWTTGDMGLARWCILRAWGCVPAFSENPPFCASSGGSANLTLSFFFCIMEPIGKSLIPVFPLLLYEKTNDAIESASIMPFNVNSKK